ncbi:unnamed protein product, partial [Closterium sp. NIES-53]
VLQRFGFTYSSPQATPLPTRHSLSALPSDESVESSGPYLELVGCLMYLMTCTRPDLAYPLSILARYVAPGRHRPEHMAAAKRVLRYLCSTSGMGLVLGGRSPVVLTGHADTSWADDQATQRSSRGYTFSLGSGSVSWRATRSSSVLDSSCEAEIYAGAMAAQELCWLTYLLTDFGEVPRSPSVLYVDNKAMLALCREQRLEHRTKHIALRYFLARELQQRGQLRLAYVASEANTADIFTKALAPCDHQRFCTQLACFALLCLTGLVTACSPPLCLWGHSILVSILTEAAALGASASASAGTAPTEALHTFTLDSGASRCFFRDPTALEQLPRPVAVSLADPSGGPVLATSIAALPCPAVPSSTLSGLYLPSFSTNLVVGSALQDAGVHQFTPAYECVTHCTCARTGRHLATFTWQPGSDLYTLTTESPQVAASASASGQLSAPCSCRSLTHRTVVWHHRLEHPSVQRLRGMHSRYLVSGLPRVLPPLPPSPAPPCLPCVEGRQRAAPHSSSFSPTETPLQTLHLDVWGPARVRGQGHERYFLLVVDDYTRYTTVFPLRTKGEVPDVLIPWIRAACLQLRQRFQSDFPVLRLHSDRGGEFSSDLLAAYCVEHGISQTFTLSASLQQNRVAERRIDLVMEVARHRASVPETSPTLHWTGEVGDASVFRVWGCRAFVRDTSADKLSSRAVPCVFLGFVPDAPGWRFYHPTSRRVFASQDVTFDESVPFYRLFPYRTAPLPPPPLFLTPGVLSVDPLPPQGAAPSDVSQVDPVEPVEVAVDSGPARGTECAEPGGAGSGGTETGGAEPGGAETGGAEPGVVVLEVRTGAEPGGAETGGAETGGAEPGGAPSSQQLREWYSQRYSLRRGAIGAGGSAGVGAGGLAGAVPQPEPPSPQRLREWYARRCSLRSGAPGVEVPPAGGPATGGTAGAGAAGGPGGAAGTVGGPGAGGGAAGAAGGAAGAGGGSGAAGGAAGAGSAGGSGAVSAAAVLRSAPSAGSCPTSGLTERREPESCPVSPVSRPVSPVRAARTGRRSQRERPPPVPGTHFMTLRPEGDPDAPDIPTPRSYAEAIADEYSSQWQSAMDAEMASSKSTGTYVDEVPPPGANIVSGMWIFRVKRPPGSPPVFKARYVAQGFSQREGVDLFQTFSPTPKMTTLRVLLHVAAQRDYELHSLDFSTAFLQGSMHEEIWLRRPPGFTGSFPPGTQWSLRRPVYGLRQVPREWHDTLRTTLAALGFAPSTADPSLFLRTDTSLPPFYILVYVDDLVFATADTEALAHVKLELQKRRTCTDLGELRSYLGLQITRDRARRTITLTQSHMVQQVLQRFGFTWSSAQATPLAIGHSLSALPSDESDVAKRVLRYLCSTSGMGLVLGGGSSVVLTGHSDASWVDDQATQRSSQCYTFSLGSGSVSWCSTRSSSVLSSSCEAEIYATTMAAQELRWLTYLLTDLGERPSSPPVLYVDNKAAIELCEEHRLEHRTKHIALRYFLARELQQRGQLRLCYVATQANTADIFTKALQPGDHQCFYTMLGLVPTFPHLL